MLIYAGSVLATKVADSGIFVMKEPWNTIEYFAVIFGIIDNIPLFILTLVITICFTDISIILTFFKISRNRLLLFIANFVLYVGILLILISVSKNSYNLHYIFELFIKNIFVVGLLEESLFRGIILNVTILIKKNLAFSVILNGTLFSTLHMLEYYPKVSFYDSASITLFN